MKTTSFNRAAVLFCLVAIMAGGEVTLDAKPTKLFKKNKVAKKAKIVAPKKTKKTT